jgi:type II secretory pathway predicted ATPase ExeA
MYESHWGLNARPFDQRADGAFYYPAEGHQAALVKLRYAIDYGCGAALAGASGVGKTLLLDSLERQLVDRGYVFVRFAYPRLAPGELLAYLADELAEQAVAPHGNIQPVDQCLRRVEAALKRLTSQQKRVVMAVDEAHSIDNPDTLETLRLLLGLESADRRAPALVLVGQTQLLATLSRTSALEERLASKCLVPAFCVEETAAYITHRLQAAGKTSEVFDASAIEAVHALARGTPRRINRLCDLALMVGYAEERQAINAEHIEAVAEELAGSFTVPQAAAAR